MEGVGHISSTTGVDGDGFPAACLFPFLVEDFVRRDGDKRLEGGMRVYFKGIALGIALLLLVLLVHRHVRSHRSVLKAGATKARATKARAGQVKGSSGSGETTIPRGRAGRQGGAPNAAGVEAPGGRIPKKLPKSRQNAQTGLAAGSRIPRKRPNDGDGLSNEAIDSQEDVVDLAEIDPLSATEPMVMQQQEDLEREKLGFQPWRGRPKPPEKVQDESKTWLKDMQYPEWYSESVVRSKVHGKNTVVGGGPLYDDPCPDAARVKEQYKKEKTQTFSYIEPGEFLPTSKNPCWYDDPNKKRLMRCIPYFYVAGVAKCGTTDLYKRIRYHPDIMEGELKEYHWWDRLRYGAPMELKYTKDSEKNDSPLPLSEYSRIITGKEIEDLKNDLRTKGHSEKICGDGSPSYLWDASQWTIFEGNEGCTEPKIVSGSFIQHAYPGSKIFLIFRQPTQRLYSRFLSRIPRYPPFKGATPKMFHDFVVNGINCYKKCFREHSIRECAYNQTLYDEAVVRIIEGMYSVFVEDWLRIFKKEQFMFIRNEDYSEDIEGHIYNVFDFLDVATLGRTEMRRILTHVSTNIGQNYDTVGPMLPETIEVLNEFYKPFALRLAELIGDDKFLWKDIAVT
ncbi:carbohydrate sulfotransferase 15-like [Littorina saxatilis]|uniref:Sulfotransferase domain-containing protein n=1 Tax=Littorina saxatilis TaxID=31220 RepID=A0AAN9BB61_9CAEN